MGLEASCLAPAATGGGTCSCSQVATGRGACNVPAGCLMGSTRLAQRGARSLEKSSHITYETPFDPPLACSLLPTAACSRAENAPVQLATRYGSVEEATQVARQRASEHDLKQAFVAYSLATQLDEDNAALCDEFGQFLLSNGQLEAAQCLFARAAALDPKNAEYCYRHGVVLQQRKQPVEAVEAFMSALQQDPRFIGALFNLGIVHRELGDHRSACDDFRRILQLSPDNHCALALLGESLAQLGDFNGAEHLLEEALRLDPSNRSLQGDLRRLRQGR